MKNLVRDYNIGPNNVRVGVALFGDNVQPAFQLDRYSNKNDIINAIDRLPFLDQTTNTPAAIRYMRTTMFTPQNGDRPNAANVAIIITDGVPRVPADVNEARRLTLQEANLARSQGINMFTIGVGPELTRDFLTQIADQPSDTHVFQVDQYRQLETILNQVAAASCAPTTPPGEFFHTIYYITIFLGTIRECLLIMCDGGVGELEGGYVDFFAKVGLCRFSHPKEGGSCIFYYTLFLRPPRT